MSLIYESYVGIIPDTLIVTLQAVLNINTGTLRIGEPRTAIPDARYHNLLGESLQEHQGNVQIEAQVIGLLLEWKDLRGYEYERVEVADNITTTYKGSVKDRKREIADQLAIIYGIDNRHINFGAY